MGLCSLWGEGFCSPPPASWLRLLQIDDHWHYRHRCHAGVVGRDSGRGLQTGTPRAKRLLSTYVVV